MGGDDIHTLIEWVRKEEDADRRWERLVEATKVGPAMVREHAERLLASDDASDLELAADLISAMPSLTVEAATWMRDQGFRIPATLPFPDADRRLLARLIGGVLLGHDEPDVVESCVIAAGKLERPEALDGVLRHVTDDDPDVREACAWTLPWLEQDSVSDRAVAALVTLADDPVAEVRDWAIAGLGGHGVEVIDTPETRRVFRAHVDDDDEDVREEAIRALGLLGDAEMLAQSLAFESVSTEAVELAGRLADSRLCEPLLALREGGWARGASGDVDAQLMELLDAAVAACCRG